jgi:cytochrome c553
MAQLRWSMRQARRGVVVLIGVLALVVARQAVAADLEAGRRKAQGACASCHGADGNSTIPAVPSLAGQPLSYTHWQLVLFRDGRRRDPQMSPVAANLTDAEIADLAAFYGAQTPARPPAASVDPETLREGRRLAEIHHCASCHAPDLPEPRYAPHIAGQPSEYIVTQLRGFKARTRGELESTMTTAAEPLNEQAIDLLARYFANLPPAAGGGRRPPP